VIASIAGLPAFLLYFVVGLALTAAFLAVYNLTTAHNEFALIRNNVPAAAVSLGLSLVGFAFPLSKALSQAGSVVDFLIWGLVALIVQIAIYWLVRLIIPNISTRIESGELAAALFLGSASLAGGMINAASMTYAP
jgi:putative membrane protein